MLTKELIEKIVQLFDENQKGILEFQQGNRNITLSKQIKYYFGDMYPFCSDEDLFLDGFALNIQKSLGIICKISKLKNFCLVLASPEAFRKQNTGINMNFTDAKDRSINNATILKEYLKTGRSMQGGTERGDDYTTCLLYTSPSPRD